MQRYWRFKFKFGFWCVFEGTFTRRGTPPANILHGGLRDDGTPGLAGTARILFVGRTQPADSLAVVPRTTNSCLKVVERMPMP